MVLNRDIASAVIKYGMKYPVIAITGPRQSGKTTMLKSVFPDYEYVSLENPDMRNFAENDPNGFLGRYPRKIIFDEVQRVPSLFSYIQTKVDESGEMGQFILSCSQNFHLMENITQSLAGRVAIFKLFPFDFQELKNAGLLLDDYLKMLIKGFYPAIYDRDIPSKVFYSNYVHKLSTSNLCDKFFFAILFRTKRDNFSFSVLLSVASACFHCAMHGFVKSCAVIFF